jgi:hypothetical protein
MGEDAQEEQDFRKAVSLQAKSSVEARENKGSDLLLPKHDGDCAQSRNENPGGQRGRASRNSTVVSRFGRKG